MWIKKGFNPQTVATHKHFIVITGSFQGLECAIANVYAPNDDGNRRELWNEILTLKLSIQLPWCMGEDFNEIKTMSERIGCLRVSRSMRVFSRIHQ